VRADGSLSGVRAVAHRETPGLGDYIDPKKDKNKKSPWIMQFGELKAADIPACKVKKDGGQIAYHTGATISARAVTNAVARAARYAAEHQDRLFAARSGGPL
jgi:Na+-translocating ferredoxin:NAD+ oxidoreductase subunit G